jgi:phosphatidylethanolamine-binding protein (PEBP) family uncharacterized protein
MTFVLHMHDMEVARNKTTDDQPHWLMWNIPGSATGLPEGVPQGAERPMAAVRSARAGPSYRGPGAPATGPRINYVFELFALRHEADVPAAAKCSRRAQMS